MRAIDLTGQRFGRLSVVEGAGTGPCGRLWTVECDCGNRKVVRAGDLRSGNTSSCGCGQKDAAAHTCVARSTHGLSKHRIMSIWRGMIARCYNEGSVSYPYYGARGVFVCNEWHNFPAFAEWAFANGYAAHLTIDRIQNDLGYSPNNCRWSTYKEQANHRTNNFLITHRGVTKNILQWAETAGISVTVLRYRIEAGWDTHTALTRERNHGLRYLG